jgi:hypothetical protein
MDAYRASLERDVVPASAAGPEERLALRRKMLALDRHILQLQAACVRPGAPPAVLARAGEFFQPAHYADVAQERAIQGRCGYPLCARALPAPRLQPTTREVVDRRKRAKADGKEDVDDVERLEAYCSRECLSSSARVVARLSDIQPFSRLFDGRTYRLALPLPAPFGGFPAAAPAGGAATGAGAAGAAAAAGTAAGTALPPPPSSSPQGVLRAHLQSAGVNTAPDALSKLVIVEKEQGGEAGVTPSPLAATAAEVAARPQPPTPQQHDAAAIDGFRPQLKPLTPLARALAKRATASASAAAAAGPSSLPAPAPLAAPAAPLSSRVVPEELMDVRADRDARRSRRSTGSVASSVRSRASSIASSVGSGVGDAAGAAAAAAQASPSAPPVPVPALSPAARLAERLATAERIAGRATFAALEALAPANLAGAEEGDEEDEEEDFGLDPEDFASLFLLPDPGGREPWAKAKPKRGEPLLPPPVAATATAPPAVHAPPPLPDASPTKGILKGKGGGGGATTTSAAAPAPTPPGAEQGAAPPASPQASKVGPKRVSFRTADETAAGDGGDGGDGDGEEEEVGGRPTSSLVDMRGAANASPQKVHREGSREAARERMDADRGSAYAEDEDGDGDGEDVWRSLVGDGEEEEGDDAGLIDDEEAEGAFGGIWFHGSARLPYDAGGKSTGYEHVLAAVEAEQGGAGAGAGAAGKPAPVGASAAARAGSDVDKSQVIGFGSIEAIGLGYDKHGSGAGENDEHDEEEEDEEEEDSSEAQQGSAAAAATGATQSTGVIPTSVSTSRVRAFGLGSYGVLWGSLSGWRTQATEAFFRGAPSPPSSTPAASASDPLDLRSYIHGAVRTSLPAESDVGVPVLPSGPAGGGAAAALGPNERAAQAALSTAVSRRDLLLSTLGRAVTWILDEDTRARGAPPAAGEPAAAQQHALAAYARTASCSVRLPALVSSFSMREPIPLFAQHEWRMLALVVLACLKATEESPLPTPAAMEVAVGGDGRNGDDGDDDGAVDPPAEADVDVATLEAAERLGKQTADDPGVLACLSVLAKEHREATAAAAAAARKAEKKSAGTTAGGRPPAPPPGEVLPPTQVAALAHALAFGPDVPTPRLDSKPAAKAAPAGAAGKGAGAKKGGGGGGGPSSTGLSPQDALIAAELDMLSAMKKMGGFGSSSGASVFGSR